MYTVYKGFSETLWSVLSPDGVLVGRSLTYNDACRMAAEHQEGRL